MDFFLLPLMFFFLLRIECFRLMLKYVLNFHIQNIKRFFLLSESLEQNNGFLFTTSYNLLFLPSMYWTLHARLETFGEFLNPRTTKASFCRPNYCNRIMVFFLLPLTLFFFLFYYIECFLQNFKYMLNFQCSPCVDQPPSLLKFWRSLVSTGAFTRGVTTGSSELCCSTSKLPLRPDLLNFHVQNIKSFFLPF